MVLIHVMNVCYDIPPDLVVYVEKILRKLRDGGWIEPHHPTSNKICGVIGKVIIEVAKLLQRGDLEMDDVIKVKDTYEGLLMRSVLRILGFSARVKLQERTTKEFFDFIRRLERTSASLL
jgi:hypothetical protein